MSSVILQKDASSTRQHHSYNNKLKVPLNNIIATGYSFYYYYKCSCYIAVHPNEEEGHQCSHTGGTSAGPLHHPRLPHVHGLVQWRVTLHAVLGRHASHNGCAGPPPAGWTGVFEAPPVCSRRGPRWLGEAPHAHHCGLAVDPSHPDGVVGKYHRGGVGGESIRPRG